MMMATSDQIMGELEHLRQLTDETNGDVNQLDQKQKQYCLLYHSCTEIKAHLAVIQNQEKTSENREEEHNLTRAVQAYEMQVNNEVEELVHLMLAMSDKHKQTNDRLSKLMFLILDQVLVNWQRDQQQARNREQHREQAEATTRDNRQSDYIGNSLHHITLDQIQEWCETIVQMLRYNHYQLKECERIVNIVRLSSLGYLNLLPNLISTTEHLISTLINRSLVIEKQPRQVLMNTSKFSATVRLLVGQKVNMIMRPPEVRVSIIKEEQVNDPGESQWKIVNDTATMEYHQNASQSSISFRYMKLSNFKRPKKNGADSVIDEKFVLRFQSELSVAGFDQPFQVLCVSLPVAVIVHIYQEPHALATMAWDDAFAERARQPFTVPDKVPWPRVAQLLDTKFQSDTGRGLTENQLNFLAGKVCRSLQVQDFTHMLVSWSQFNKDFLEGCIFTFGEWFFAALKVTREHLAKHWRDGSIHGFIGRLETENKLITCQTGTFLLRFSDTMQGGVAIAWVHEDSNTASSKKKVYFLKPIKKFTERRLDYVIGDLDHIRFLYPNIPKEQVFEVDSNDQQASANGYIEYFQRTVVPGFTARQDMLPSSPDSMLFDPCLLACFLEDTNDILQTNMMMTEDSPVV